MTMSVWGVVREGRVVPSSPLPEGAHVEIRLIGPLPDVPADLQAEFEAWGRASDKALVLVERLADEEVVDERGEVWRVRIPFAPGHAQAGNRPALIVQNDSLIALLPTVLIIPFTSSPGAARFPGTFIISPDSQNGLTVPSVALVFQLRAMDKRDCLRCIGVLDDPTLGGILAIIDQLIR